MPEIFGESPVLRFFIAFLVVFALIGLTAWLIRRFGSGALGGQGARGRAPRLAVIESGAVDGRRKLVLIRRDNIEHLIMIGGPTDIVVEANIVRGQTSRESIAARSAAAPEPAVRPAATEDSWHQEPARPARPVRAPLAEDSTQWSLQPELAPPSAPAAPPVAPKRSRSADTLAHLAAELNVRPSEPAAPPVAPRAPVPTESMRAPKPPVSAPASSDQNLADMAQRLEAALRRPAPPAAAAPPPPRPAPPAAAAPPKPAPAEAAPAAPPPPPPAAVKAPELAPAAPEAPPPPARSEAKPEPKSEDVFGSLEEEMANLLGRPTGKPT